MRRFLVSAALVAVALVLQLTAINALRLPGGGVPDLVLLVVAALGLAGGPVPGAITGFAAGLALDLAPPGSGMLGEYALVLCLVGWACGRFRGTLARSAAVPMIIAAAAAVAGEIMIAALGLALQPAQVTWTSVGSVLPSVLFYDVAVSPFVLYLVLLAGAWLGDAAAAGPGARAGQARSLSGGLAGRSGLAGQPGLAAAQGLAARQGLAGPTGSAGPAGGAVLLGLGGWLAGPPQSRRARRAAARRTPKLAPGSGRSGDGWVGGSAARRGLGGQAPSAHAPGGPAWSGLAWRGQALRGQAFSSQALRNLARGSRPHGSGSALRAGVAGSAAGSRAPRTLAARPVHLRLAAGRKRDGAVGNMLAGRSVVAGRAPGGRALSGRALSGRSASSKFLGSKSPGRDGVAGKSLGRDGLGGKSLSRRSLSRLGRRRPGRGFRPVVMPGGSAVARPPAGGHLAPAAPVRFGSPRRGAGRLAAGRRRDGLIGGGALTRAGRTGRRPSAPRFRIRGGGPVRSPVTGSVSAGGLSPEALHSLRRQAPQPRLRMHSRRGDGVLGGLPAGSRTAGPRGGGARPATPRFRARPRAGGRPPNGKRPRFGHRRWSVLSLLPGRLGARSPGRRTATIPTGATRGRGRWSGHRWSGSRRSGGRWSVSRWSSIRRTGGLR